MQDHSHTSARNAAQATREPSSRSIAQPRAPQDFAAGIFLIAVAIFALWQSSELTMGTLRQLGPGMVPHTLAVLVAVCGVALIINAFRGDGAVLERWAVRGPLFVFGATLVFAIVIRPLGLAVAGPLLIVISGMASHETKWLETLIFGIVMTAFCLVLFRLLLSLPIPVAPWLIGY